MDIKNIDFKDVSEKIIEPLNERHKEVIIRRFGLKDRQERETLEKIGKDFGVCRERIRQIEQMARKTIIKKNENILNEIFESFKRYFESYGFSRKEESIFQDFNKENKNYVFFLLSIGKEHFKRFPEKKEFFPFWNANLSLVESTKKIIQSVVKLLDKKKKLLSINEIIKKIKIPKTIQLSENILSSYLEISKLILKTEENVYGLKTWPEINPRRIRDKVYLLFKKYRKPLHFKSVKELMPEVNLNTIHNELIKDERFVLIGRGVYALSEWGYMPGKVKEVIFKLIKQQGRPLTKEEILNLTLKQRMVKKFTVYQYLSDQKMFRKREDGRYYVAEA